jgi:hypothetical protein
MVVGREGPLHPAAKRNMYAAAQSPMQSKPILETKFVEICLFKGGAIPPRSEWPPYWPAGLPGSNKAVQETEPRG